MSPGRDSPRRPWHLYALALVAVAVAVLAVLEIGPPPSSARTSREIVTAQQGVIQSTVTGTGNVEAGTDVNANFRTSGTLADVFVSVGQHVNEGQLLATLDPTVAQLSLDQAEQNLTAAEDQLTAVENGTASSASGAGASGTTASLTTSPGTMEYVSDTRGPGRPTAKTPTTTSTSATSTTSGSTGNARTTTTPTTSPSTNSPTRTAPQTGTSRTGNSSAGASASGAGAGGGSTRQTTTTTTTSTTPSPASIASAQASVYGAQASVQNAETALANTKLYAPTSGTIVSLASLSPGGAVSAGATSNASSSSSASGSSSSGGSGTSGAGASAGSLGGSGGSSSSSAGGSSGAGSSGSSSSPFAEIVNTSSLTMTVAFSESDVSKVQVGQPATIAMDALSGVRLASHVSAISTVGTTSSGVVSYDATLTLDQTDSRVKPGMSASATVIVGQAQGITVPNQAVSGSGSLGTVNVLRNGKTVQQQVIVGLRGDSRTQIISGLKSGQQLVVTIILPALSNSTTTGSGSSGTLGGGRFGGAGGFGGGGGVGGGAFLRGGG